MVAEKIKRLIVPVLAGLLVSVFAGVPAMAGSLAVLVTNDKGEPLEHAVVTLSPRFELSAPMPPTAESEMRQENTLFAPFVLPVRSGTRVSFPNFDEARHHVYSFSKAKRFELRLYGKDETNSIEFDQPGVVALGCNIHDNMLAYIYVTDAPIYAKTDANGRAVFAGLENGRYDVAAWHPGERRNGAPDPKEVSISDDRAEETIAVRLRRVWGQQRPPADGQY